MPRLMFTGIGSAIDTIPPFHLKVVVSTRDGLDGMGVLDWHTVAHLDAVTPFFLLLGLSTEVVIDDELIFSNGTGGGRGGHDEGIELSPRGGTLPQTVIQREHLKAALPPLLDADRNDAELGVDFPTVWVAEVRGAGVDQPQQPCTIIGLIGLNAIVERIIDQHPLFLFV